MEYTLNALVGTGCHDISRFKLLSKASAVILRDKITAFQKMPQYLNYPK